MLKSKMKLLVRQSCPPFLWSSLQRLRRSIKSRFGGTERERYRVVTSLQELDREMLHCEEQMQVSSDAFRSALTSFRFDAGSLSFPSDPDSREYRQAQMELYSRISGRKSYSPYQDEVTPGDLSSYITTPFPYSTYSHNTVSEQLIAVGNLIQVMGLKPAGSILEFGPGWGLSTLELVQMGYRVTAVDVCEMFVELIRERTRRLEQKVSLACSDMLEYRPDQQFDRVLFYECFHHCSDHQRMIRNLDQMVSPGGAVVFAGEPILDDFHAPWGVRLDGMSAWSIRKFGWLELGFRTDYFRRLLRRHGWSLESFQSKDLPWFKVFLSRRLRDS